MNWPETSKNNLIAVDTKQANNWFAKDNIFDKIGLFTAHAFGHNGGYRHGKKDAYGIMADGKRLNSLDSTWPSMGNKSHTIQQVCQIYCSHNNNQYIFNRLWKISPPE